jgi:TorA maturation chaperone TorD
MPMSVSHDISTSMDRVLARAVLCRALKLGFDQPTNNLLQALFSDDGREALRLAALSLEGGESRALSALVERIGALPVPELEQLRRSYERLFGHTLRGRVCPYECEYGRQALLLRAQELADLGGFYAAFGLRSAETRHERPDHVACEFEFVEFLSRKEFWAIENDDAEMADVTLRALAEFLRQHLARFGRAFARSLQDAEPRGFYGMLGAFCEAFLMVECDRLGVPIGPEVLELRTAASDDVPMACGSEDLVELGGGAGAAELPARGPNESA